MPKSRYAVRSNLNNEGLSLSKWLSAVGPIPLSGDDMKLMDLAWRQNEDPADWKRHYQLLERFRVAQLAGPVTVLVRQLDAKQWAEGLADTLSNKAGGVERVERSNTANYGRVVVVGLDEFVELGNGIRSKSFTFSPLEVEIVS